MKGKYLVFDKYRKEIIEFGISKRDAVRWAEKMNKNKMEQIAIAVEVPESEWHSSENPDLFEDEEN